MTFRATILPLAEHDAQQIFDWIGEQSRDGANRWWTAMVQAIFKLAENPLSYGFAPENGLANHELRQFLFKTRHGRTYRGLFTLVGDEIRVLRIRGPGQPPLKPDDFEGSPA
jgi:plasmid stabilization system protein ParE